MAWVQRISSADTTVMKVDSKKLKHGCRMLCAGSACCLGLGLQDGHLPTFWLVLLCCQEAGSCLQILAGSLPSFGIPYSRPYTCPTMHQAICRDHDDSCFVQSCLHNATRTTTTGVRSCAKPDCSPTSTSSSIYIGMYVCLDACVHMSNIGFLGLHI